MTNRPYLARSCRVLAAITVGPTIDFLIETFGKREDRTARAVHLVDAARWDLAVAGWQVRSRVRTALLDLWAAQRRLALTQQQLKLQDELVGPLEQRFAVGEASSSNVMLARIPRQQITFAIRNLEQMEAAARAQLATALGVPARALERVDTSRRVRTSAANFCEPERRQAAPGRAHEAS